MTALAFAAAVAAMLANSLASLLESSGSRRATPGRATWRQPRYLAGLACDGLRWALSVAALRVLPGFAVQSVLAGTVPVTAMSAAGGSPRRIDCRTHRSCSPRHSSSSWRRWPCGRGPRCWAPRWRGSPSAGSRCRCGRCTSRRPCGRRCGTC